jgi:hypothetical protein
MTTDADKTADHHGREKATGAAPQAALSGRIALGLIVLLMAPVGLQATFAPRSFYDDFPIGRGWVIADGGAYDEHLVRDVGAAFLALVVLTVWATWTGRGVVPVALAWVVQGVVHFVYHIGHLHGLDGLDLAGMLTSLVAVPVLALIAAGSSVGNT